MTTFFDNKPNIRRYYAHYIVIYPDIYLKDYIVEVGDIGNILCYYPFGKEIENTNFYSGMVVFSRFPIDETKLLDSAFNLFLLKNNIERKYIDINFILL